MQKELISLIFCKLLNNDNKQIDIIKQTLEKVSNSVQVFFTPLDNSFVFISSIPVTRKKGILNSIENNISFVVNSLDVEIQIQSVYACGETKEENAVYDFFGGADYNFLFISTIKNNSSIEKKDLSNYLEKGKREKKYDYALYNSLGVGDMYIFWKSNSIDAIITAIQDLYENSIISYEHTVFSVEYYNLISEELFSYALNQIKEETMDASFVISTLLPTMGISTQLFLDMKNAEEKQIISTKDIYKGIKQFVCNNKDDSSFLSDIFPFFRSQFRSDLRFLSSEINDSKKLNIICKNIFERLKKAKSILKIEWLDETIELARLMVVMSNNYIFESPCYLLLDSINLFCDWLDYTIKEKYENESFIASSEDDEIQFFVRAWNRLLTSVVGTDGISIKTGTNSPLSYNICYTIIEYCRVYFDELSKFLIDIEEDKASLLFACIITPKLCRRIKTVELFFDNRSKDSLLAVEVPATACYDPFLILTSLTHESAHYCGDKTRQKDERQKVFVYCVSKILCDSLGIKDAESLAKLIQLISNRLSSKNNSGYLSDLTKTISRIVQSILQYNMDMEEIISETINNTPEEEISDVLDIILNNINTISLGDYSITSHIERIEYLLKECYADVIMIYILQLSMSEYLQVFSAELSRLKPEHQGKIKTIIQRILVVRKTCINNSKAFDAQINSIDALPPWFFDELSHKFESFDCSYDLFLRTQSSDAEVFEKNDYPLDIYHAIIRYLSKCWETLEEMIENNSNNQNKNKLNKIRHIYSMIAKEDMFGTEAVNNTIKEYRSQIISRYNESGDFIKKHHFC